MDENNKIEIEPLKDLQPVETNEPATKTVLLEKRKTSSKRPSTTKKGEKPKWSNTFAFLNDAKRDKLMQVPELPVKVKKSKKKLQRSISVKVTKNEIKSDENDENNLKTKSSNSDNNDESENDNEQFERRNSNTDSNKSKAVRGNSASTKNSSKEEAPKSPIKTNDKPIQSKKSNLKRPKFKTNIDLDKINYDNNFNYHDDLHYSIDQALNNLHVSTTYKNLIRSMKANV
jgi:hypothetical protein